MVAVVCSLGVEVLATHSEVLVTSKRLVYDSGGVYSLDVEVLTTSKRLTYGSGGVVLPWC